MGEGGGGKACSTEAPSPRQVQLVEDGIHELGKAHNYIMRFTPPLRRFPSVALETVPLFPCQEDDNNEMKEQHKSIQTNEKEQ